MWHWPRETLQKNRVFIKPQVHTCGMGELRGWGWRGATLTEPGSPPLPERARSRSGNPPGCPAAPALDARASTILGTTPCPPSLLVRTYAVGAGECCEYPGTTLRQLWRRALLLSTYCTNPKNLTQLQRGPHIPRMLRDRAAMNNSTLAQTQQLGQRFRCILLQHGRENYWSVALCSHSDVKIEAALSLSNTGK